MTPTELISAMLKAEVDLLWNGGIGTYVKASSESNAEVGDRANDTLRVNGDELRCRVVGEGGNLGFTQMGRIEYALRGGRIYMDAIDNSAGVDCSDHEVNIKILLDAIVEAGDMTEKQRNELLASMTDEVGDLVSARQLPADPGHKPGPRARAPHGRRARPLHPLPGARGQARPEPGVFARRRGARRAALRQQGAHRPRARHPVVLQQDHDLPGPPRLGRARGPLSLARAGEVLPDTLEGPFSGADPRAQAAPPDHGHPRHEQPGEPLRPLLRLQAGRGDGGRGARHRPRLHGGA